MKSFKLIKYKIEYNRYMQKEEEYEEVCGKNKKLQDKWEHTSIMLTKFEGKIKSITTNNKEREEKLTLERWEKLIEF